jgi:putative two-component system response regulator
MTGDGAAGAAHAQRILVVDDEEPIRRALHRMLTGAGYECAMAGSVTEARQALAAGSFDLVLSDVLMPGESGFSLLRHIHLTYPDLAVLMVTAVDDPAVAGPVARDGAYGYIVKPYEASAVLINVASALRRRTEHLDRRVREEQLEEQMTATEEHLATALHRASISASALWSSQEETVDRLALAAEWRDPCTGKHLQTMSLRTERLAQLAQLSPDDVELLRIASKLHDIGKVGLPDHILLKEGKYTDEERAIMQQHSRIGARMLAGSDSPMMLLGAEIALAHHEWWDGNGYPNGLAGTAIPISGRIAAVADVFDALRSERLYKPPIPVDRALAIMRSMRGSQFDPELLDLFMDDVETNGEPVVDGSVCREVQVHAARRHVRPRAAWCAPAD